MQRHDVASTLMRHCINVMCLVGKDIFFRTILSPMKLVLSAAWGRKMSLGTLVYHTFTAKYVHFAYVY